MLRITSVVMMLIFRLAVVLSLAGYSMSAANAAMHPAMPDSASFVENSHSAHGAHAHSKMTVEAHHSDHATATDVDTGNNGCCQDYCGVFAIDAPMPKLVHPVAASIKGFMNDLRAFGESPALHRPPNI
ncbi:hypothetical protein ABID21_001144 [Pseudorhizobium tarimense]|uniref:Uncharacterized protein n=1 Tax=Pseudorhizobium tarimense TaxID=1079109 RepID=A0ABV2H3C0_9HYPH|nr:hypothetical protein [Pseudorhizobium tarimense]MCJ8518532.1 hypothetical protein [Pseudorhizobium tarimense]